MDLPSRLTTVIKQLRAIRYWILSELRLHCGCLVRRQWEDVTEATAGVSNSLASLLRLRPARHDVCSRGDLRSTYRRDVRTRTREAWIETPTSTVVVWCIYAGSVDTLATVASYAIIAAGVDD